DRHDRDAGRAAVAPPAPRRSAGAPRRPHRRRFRLRAGHGLLARPPLGAGVSAALKEAADDPRAAIRARVAAAGTSFYWAMRLLPEARREAMFAVYAFCRDVDDIADSDDPPAVKRAELARWRRDIEAIYDDRPHT